MQSPDLGFSTQIEEIKKLKGKILKIGFFLSQEKNLLIKFDLFSSDNQLDSLPVKLGESDDFYLAKILADSHPADKSFERIKVTQSPACIEINSEPTNVFKSSIIYKFPALPQAALKFLACLFHFVATEYNNFNSLYINKHDNYKSFTQNDDKFDLSSEKSRLNVYINMYIEYIYVAILGILENKKEYAETRATIYKFYKLHLINPRIFLLDLNVRPDPSDEANVLITVQIKHQKYVNDNPNTEISVCAYIYALSLENTLLINYFDLAEAHPENSSNSWWAHCPCHAITGTTEQKKSKLQFAIQDLSKSDRKKYIPILIESFVKSNNLGILSKLYREILGNPYWWFSTEWHWMKFWELKLIDGRLTIVNLEKNHVHQLYYGTAYFSDFAEKLGLQFATNTAIENNKIIFTIESTKKLMEKLNLDYDANRDLTLHNIEDATKYMKEIFIQDNLALTGFLNKRDTPDNIRALIATHLHAISPTKSIDISKKNFFTYIFNIFNCFPKIIESLGENYGLIDELNDFSKDACKSEINELIKIFKPFLLQIVNEVFSINYYLKTTNLDNSFLKSLILKIQKIIDTLNIIDLIKLTSYKYYRNNPDTGRAESARPLNKTYFKENKNTLQMNLENIKEIMSAFDTTHFITNYETSYIQSEFLKAFSALVNNLKLKNVSALIDHQTGTIERHPNTTRKAINKLLESIAPSNSSMSQPQLETKGLQLF